MKRCARCDRETEKVVRGLCHSCYQWARTNGKIEEYPLKRRPLSRSWRAKYDPDAIDEVVVRRILSGEWGLKANPSEKREVCRLWTARGGSLRTLESFTGWNTTRYFRLTEAA